MSAADLYAHLAGGLTTVCRCWSVQRRDAVMHGFTDHDRNLTFDGITFRADSGLTARAISQTTGLAVDNTEALGALTDASVTEADIDAGRFDGAQVKAWLVNWSDVEERLLQFRGSIGEMRRAAGAFQAELRGLTEALNQPRGLVYQKSCGAILGDRRCGVDLSSPEFSAELVVETTDGGQRFKLPVGSRFEPHWFERGRIVVKDGKAAGLMGLVKRDVVEGSSRAVELWEPLRAVVAPGDTVRVEAGCDKRTETCRKKFRNFVNFRGFPDIPGEDWLISVPSKSRDNSGGSLIR